MKGSCLESHVEPSRTPLVFKCLGRTQCNTIFNHVRTSFFEMPKMKRENKDSLFWEEHDFCCCPPVRWGLLDFMLVVPVLLLFLPLLVLLTLLLRLHSEQPFPVFPATPQPRPVFPARPQPRPSEPSVPCRTSTATIWAQCSLPDLNRDHLSPVFPAGPQPRPSEPSVPCRTSTATIWAQCSLPDLKRDHIYVSAGMSHTGSKWLTKWVKALRTS